MLEELRIILNYAGDNCEIDEVIEQLIDMNLTDENIDAIYNLASLAYEQGVADTTGE